MKKSVLDRAISAVWQTTFEMAIDPDAGGANTRIESVCSAEIPVSGFVDGLLIVECSSTIARRAASTLFSTPPGECGNEELEDAILEIANITAGTIINTMPESCQIGLPVMRDSSESEETGIELNYSCDGERIRVLIQAEGTSELKVAAMATSEDK